MQVIFEVCFNTKHGIFVVTNVIGLFMPVFKMVFGIIVVSESADWTILLENI